MIISLCGNSNEKNILIKELKREYKDKLVICDYFYISFRWIIENKNMMDKLLDKYRDIKKARILFNEYLEKEVNIKVDEFIKNNKDKIIVLVTENVITPDIDKMCYFDKSDLKVLVLDDEDDYECFYNDGYDKEKFDYLIDVKKESDIRKLVKL